MKKFKILFLASLLVSCADPIQEDLIDYVNNGILPLIESEEEITTLIDMMGEMDDDALTYELLENSILPMTREYLEQLQAVRPATPEVRELHEMAIEIWTLKERGLIQIYAAYEEEDMTMITAALESIAESTKFERRFENKLESLMVAHDVEIL